MFKPSLIGKDCDGLADALKKCIRGIPKDIREELMQNTILSGGSTLFPGFETRLCNELGSWNAQKSQSLIDGYFRRLNQNQFAFYEEVHNLTARYLEDGLQSDGRYILDGQKGRILAPPERQYSAWIGGSILASSDSFEECWITKDDWDEYGPGIVHRKCF